MAVKNRFEAFDNEGQSKWNTLKLAMINAAKETTLLIERKSKNRWITNEILELMSQRQQIFNRKSKEYKQLDGEIKIKCREAKEIRLNKECAEIEKYKNNESVAMHKKIKEISGRNICSSSGCIKSKTGDVIMEKEQALRR